MSETLQIDDLTVAVRRSPRRKRIELTVERDGGITVAVPAVMELPAVERLVRQRLVTLYSALQRKRDTLSVQPAKEYVTGEGFYYLGRKYRLKLIDDAPGAELRLHAGRFLLPRDRADQGRGQFIRWYTDHAQPWLVDRVATLQDRVAVKPKGVQVRDLGYRWASCGQGGKLYFHWRVILLPPPRIKYLVLHELCHLHHHDHSPAFYQRLSRAAPNYQNHDHWLRMHGDDYRL